MNIEFKINLKIEKEAVVLETKSKEEETIKEHNTNERTEGDQTGSQIYNFTITGGSNNTNTSNNEYDKQCTMDFSSLKELVNNDNLEDVLFTLRDDKNGFKAMLDDKLLPDTIVLIIKLLCKICNSNLEENVSLLLTSVLESDFSQKIVTFVSTLALQTPKGKNLNKYFWDDPDDFWINVVTLSKTFNKLLPSASCNFNLMIIKIIKIFIPHIEENHNIHISDSIKKGFVDLCDVIQKISKDVENKEKISKGHQGSIVSTDSDVLRFPEVGSDLLCEAALSCGHYCKRLSHVEDRNHENYECREQCEKNRVAIVPAAGNLKLPVIGSDLLCEADLGCGHTCNRFYHLEDRNHENYDCREKCEKHLCDDPEHVCRKFCFEPCGPCPYPVERLLKCGHSVNIECHLDLDQYKCAVTVKTVLPCLHSNEKLCSADDKEECTFPCDARIEPCGHACSELCHIEDDPDHLQYTCTKLCEKKCKICDHVFEIACNANPDDYQFEVEKMVPDCNHRIRMKCCQPPSREFCEEECGRKLACGHLCTNKCNEECITRCMEIVDCYIIRRCGHNIKKISCYYLRNHDDELLLENCAQKCDTVLLCNHKCLGTCYTCFQGRFHQRCKQKCGALLICNHECPIPCGAACKPCKKMCEYRCVHSKCKKLCGSPCTPCKERCPRLCMHQKCSKTCGEICDVKPCEEPCTKILKCGHDCVGFCGDPCPKLCRVCDEGELTETFFGTEDKKDERFVELQDCGHTLESTGMKRWLDHAENDGGDAKEIKPIVCPKCKTTIKTTLRYSDFVKECMDDIGKVKTRVYGDPKELKAAKYKLRQDIENLSELVKGNASLSRICQKLLARLEDTRDNRLQNINMTDLNAIRMKLDLIQMILTLFENKKLLLTNLPLSSCQVSFIASCLGRNIDSTTQQEAYDLKLEIERLNLFIQFEGIHYNYHEHLPEVKNRITEITKIVLEGNFRYTEDDDLRIKKALEDLKELTSSTTLKEKQEVFKAMQYGCYWYKCPKGHLYTSDTGPAYIKQSSKCLDCGASIGGNSNRGLLPDNTRADP